MAEICSLRGYVSLSTPNCGLFKGRSCLGILHTWVSAGRSSRSALNALREMKGNNAVLVFKSSYVMGIGLPGTGTRGHQETTRQGKKEGSLSLGEGLGDGAQLCDGNPSSRLCVVLTV